LGLLSLSRDGLDRRNKKVFEWRRRLDIPLLIFMGGGYAKPINDTVDAFCDLFIEASKEVTSITEN
jgi:acetoin utilization deacetylase AcuC-like enzyme